MGEKIIVTCDICEMDGDEDIIAVAKYRDIVDKEWFVCKKHLEDVIKAQLRYLLLEKKCTS